jgi:hypothetical protein
VDRETLAPLGPVGEVSLVLQPDQGEPPARDVLQVVIGDFGGRPYGGILGRDALTSCTLKVDAEGLTIAF